MSKDAIARFLESMRAEHAEQIDAIDLPDGTRACVDERIAEGDGDTLTFMLKLGYLMGLQTGFAAGRAGEGMPDVSTRDGPIKA